MTVIFSDFDAFSPLINCIVTHRKLKSHDQNFIGKMNHNIMLATHFLISLKPLKIYFSQCQKLLILSHLSKSLDVPAGWYGSGQTSGFNGHNPLILDLLYSAEIVDCRTHLRKITKKVLSS